MLPRGETINEIAAKYEINPVMLSRRKVGFFNRSSEKFEIRPTETDKELKKTVARGKTRVLGWTVSLFVGQYSRKRF